MMLTYQFDDKSWFRCKSHKVNFVFLWWSQIPSVPNRRTFLHVFNNTSRYGVPAEHETLTDPPSSSWPDTESVEGGLLLDPFKPHRASWPSSSSSCVVGCLLHSICPRVDAHLIYGLTNELVRPVPHLKWPFYNLWPYVRVYFILGSVLTGRK